MRTNPRPYARCPTKAHVAIRLLVPLLLAVTVSAQDPSADPILQGDGTLKVMTYNTFVGTEYSSGLLSPDPDVFREAVTQLIVDVRASDPPGRAMAVARQIAAAHPHLVGLQEVATWSTGTTKDTLEVEFDYLALLLDALAALGVQYTPVVTSPHFDVTLPSTTGYLRNVWSVVVLARADLAPDDFSYTNSQAAQWTPPCTLSYPLPALDGTADCPDGLPPSGVCIMPFPRGWAFTDVTYRDKQLRFIAAHLESASTSKNRCQANELLNGPANTTWPVVVAADLNCDLSNTSDPKYPACHGFLDAGFMDSWSAANGSEPGYTKDLPDLTMRSDYLMARGRFRAQAAVLVGEEPEDMTSGTPRLWASDHCGVVTRLQAPGSR